MKNRISLLFIINSFFFLVVSLFIAYVVFDFNSIFRTLDEIQISKVKEYVKNKNSVIAPLIKYKFYDVAYKELNNFKKNIKYIKIKSGDFTYEKGNKKNLKLIKLPLEYKNRRIGEITVGFDDKKLLHNFSEKYLRKVFIFIVILFAIFLISFFYIKKKISSLNNLAKKIEKLNFRKTKKIELLDNYFEITNITNSINHLLNQVVYFYNNQKRLFINIALYKKQLETAQKLADIFSWIFDCEKGEFKSQNFLKKKLGFNSFNEFLNSIINKEIFFNEIEKAKNGNYEFEIFLDVKNSKDEKFHFKVQGKSLTRHSKKIILGLFIDVTDVVNKQKQIEFLAYHDTLTGLINRVYFKEMLKKNISLAKRNRKKLAVVFVDLDNFKYVNDTFGHDVGDLLLVEIANRLKSSFRESDTVARIGGDEFVLILNDIKNTENVVKIMDKVKYNLQKPVYIKDYELNVTFSAGIAVFPDDAEKMENLIKFADIAMYESKKEGKNKFYFINSRLKREVEKYYEIINDLKKALQKDDELILFFQPKVDIKEKKVSGVEALIRWNHPQKGLLGPSCFINVAEKSNLINFIDDYILEKAVKTLKRWEKENALNSLTMAVNISANKFNEQNFVEKIAKLIEKYKIDPHKLQIEITETLSMKNVSYTINVLKKIRDMGIKIALDDFGTGYSSLNYLKKLPFDVLKIDQSFVMDLMKDRDDFIITKTIAEIGKILNKRLVAEGVENKEILNIISDFGIYIIQGYYFSEPLPEVKLREYVVNFDYKNYI